jgi:hypothetical protein
MLFVLHLIFFVFYFLHFSSSSLFFYTFYSSLYFSFCLSMFIVFLQFLLWIFS